jgi:hypothetical protein
MSGCSLADQPGVEPIAGISVHKQSGTVSCGCPSGPVVSCRHDILTELLDPFDMLGRDPVEKAGGPGISRYACGDLDTA